MALRKLPSVTNVAAGNTATIRIPSGPTYEKLLLVYTGVTLAQMSNIRLNLNGREARFHNSGTELDLLNQFFGRPASAGILEMLFRRPEMEKLDDQYGLSLGTADVENVELEIDIDAAAANPAIEVWAVQRAPSKLGLFSKWKRFANSFSTTGQQEIDNIPKGPRIATVAFMNANVSALEVEINSTRIFEGSKDLIHRLQTDEGRVPDASFLAADFAVQNLLQHALVTDPKQVYDMRYRLTLDTAGSVPILVEYIDDWYGL